MIRVFKTIDGIVHQIHQNTENDAKEKDCWIALTKPSIDELKLIAEKYNIEIDDLKSALDEEERSRIMVEDSYTMLVLDIPFTEFVEDKESIYTIPFAIIKTDEIIVTVCLEDTQVLTVFMDGRVKGFDTANREKFIYQMLYRNASMYLQYLRIIDKKSKEVEKKLHNAQRNQDLLDMLELEKSLVYMNASLHGNEKVLEKLGRIQTISHSEEDQELLEDVIVENKQAIEMAKIYTDILSETMDVYSSVIVNSVNSKINEFAVILIALAIPMILSGFFAMNVGGIPFIGSSMGFWIIGLVCVVCGLASSVILSKMKKFK